MPRNVTGLQSILRGARLICRMVNRFGLSGLDNWTSEEFKTAVGALVVACEALDAADDFPGAVDRNSPGYLDGTPS